MCITFKSEGGIWTIEEDCSTSNSKEKEVHSFVLCVDQPIDCQQEDKERSYRRFVKVVVGIIILALLLVLFGKIVVFMLAVKEAMEYKLERLNTALIRSIYNTPIYIRLMYCPGTQLTTNLRATSKEDT